MRGINNNVVKEVLLFLIAYLHTGPLKVYAEK